MPRGQTPVVPPARRSTSAAAAAGCLEDCPNAQQRPFPGAAQSGARRRRAQYSCSSSPRTQRGQPLQNRGGAEGGTHGNGGHRDRARGRRRRRETAAADEAERAGARRAASRRSCAAASALTDARRRRWAAGPHIDARGAACARRDAPRPERTLDAGALAFATAAPSTPARARCDDAALAP